MTRFRTVLAMAAASLVGGVVAVPAAATNLPGSVTVHDGANKKLPLKAALIDSKTLPAVEKAAVRDATGFFISDISKLKKQGGVTTPNTPAGTVQRTDAGKEKEKAGRGPAEWACLAMSILPGVGLVIGMIRAYARGGRSRPSFHRPA